MSASNKLDQYLASYRQRLERLTLMQGIAAIALVLLIFAVIGAYFAIESGFARSTIVTFRIILVLALAAVGLRFLAQPLQRLKSGISNEVETRASASATADSSIDSELGFNGRIETYIQMKAENNPFLELLAEDTLAVSEAYPVNTQIETRELGLAGLVSTAAVLTLVYLLVAGPGNLNYSLRNLFAGWAVDGLLPPQSIVVNPGDQSIRRGANLRITAEMEGFSPDNAIIHVQSGDDGWQEVELVPSPGGFEFTFFSMQEPMAYYISSTGLRSPEYDIQVVDLPSIESLSLTYNYPEWTQRETEIYTQGDINALADTRIELTVTTSSPLSEGELILNEVTQGLSLNGNEATTEFTISVEGEYYLAAIVGGEQVRLSDDYFIRITEDGKPVIEFIRPGEDYNASSIEEVLARVEASDDYGLDNVQIKYSINGNDWQSVDLTATGRELSRDHIFMLEDMRTEVIREVTTNLGAFNIVLSEESELQSSEGSSELDADGNAVDSEPVIEQIPLQPGDLISYYAEASDRTQTIRTDMFFIQVQSYTRRYTQSQISGGGGGGGGGDQQDEISQRQRQIIVSTWNLIREQAEGDADSQVEINSTLLSELQLTLADQAQTLAQRTRARQLDRDDDIERFIENLERAIQSMYPSSEQLALIKLEDALQPAQEALQYLLRAEAIFNDITVTQQEGGGGGGGGGASQDLAEMFELEMDLEKNQYETGSNASPQAQQQEEDDIMSQLDELARRQEQLANNLRNQQQISEAQKYQQELLRREVEELQEQLERMQEQSQSAQQQASNSQSGQSQSGQPGQGQGQSQSEQNDQQQDSEQQQESQIAQQSELQRRIDSALRAMEDSANAMNGNLTQDELQRAAEEAQRQLEGARDQVAQDQLANMQEAFNNMSSQADEMLRDQQRMEQTLQDAVVTALEERENGDPNSRGMSLQEEWNLAAEKQELATDLQNLRRQMLNSTQRFDEQVPEAARELQEANEELAENGLEQAISDSALYIDSGYGLFIAGNDSGITADLRDLAQSLTRAQQLASNTGVNGDSDLDRAQAQARELRAQLQQLAQQGGQPGQGQQQGEGEAQSDQETQGQGQEGQGEGQQGQGQGQASGGGGFGQFTANGGWNGEGNQQSGPIDLPEDFFSNVDNLTQAARGALDQLDLNTEELAEMYDLIRELEYSRVNRNDDILAQEFNSMLALIEQLEAGLQIDTNANDPNNVRTAVAELIPDEYRESVAEYYRRLSSE